MKLAAKLVLLFLFCLSLVVGVFSCITQQQAQNLALAEHERHAADLAATLQSALSASTQQTSSEVEQVLIAWSRKIQNVQIRLVNPNHRHDSSLTPAVPADLVVEATEIITLIHPDHAGHSMMYTYVPLGDSAGSRLEVAAPESFWSERLAESLRSSAIALFVVSAVTSLVILLGGLWMVAKPLNKLVEKVQRVGHGDLTGPVDLRRGDELGRLGQAVNEMCQQLEQQRQRIESETQQRLAAVEQLRHADRLRTVGRLAAGLAHEIGTPLNVVSGRAELIAGGKLSPEDIQESARTIKTQSQRIAGIVQELLNFARRKSPQRQAVNLVDVLQETVALLRPMADKRQVKLELKVSCQTFQADVDAAQLQHVFTNLIFNALHATAPTGLVQLAIDRQENLSPPGDIGEQRASYWRISVTDNGIGISPDVIDNVFEPFFTTKDVGEGTGLGLSIAYGIVQEHAGWIDVQSQLGVGSTFAVFLPA